MNNKRTNSDQISGKAVLKVLTILFVKIPFYFVLIILGLWMLTGVITSVFGTSMAGGIGVLIFIFVIGGIGSWLWKNKRHRL